MHALRYWTLVLALVTLALVGTHGLGAGRHPGPGRCCPAA